MPRRSTGPVYYKSKNAWFANLNGERWKLIEGPKGPTKKIAEESYDRLVKEAAAQTDGDRSECWTVLQAYIDEMAEGPNPLSPNRLYTIRWSISSFTPLFGNVPVRDLTVKHVRQWIAHNRSPKAVTKGPIQKHKTKWGDASVTTALRVLNTAFKWAAGPGQLIGQNPFEKPGVVLPWPKLSYLGKRLAITGEEHALLLAQAERRQADRQNFAGLLRLLRSTGARPAELYLARADEWNPELQAFEIDPDDPRSVGRLKTRNSLRRKGLKRTIRVKDELVPLVEKLIGEADDDGLLFRSEWNKRPWDNKSIATRFTSLIRWASQKGKVRKKLTLYSYRHAYVTEWITADKDVMKLCELLNTSVKMLQDHYSHLFEKHKVFLDAVNDFGL
jgi:site-specific recombinase XerD